VHPGIEEGIRLFNAQEFFEEHEALEAVWLRLKLSMISALTDRRYGVCARGIYFSNTAPVSGVVKRLNDTRQCSAP